MEHLIIYKPGSKVKINGIDAVITKCMITLGGNCVYNCVWWSGRDKKEDWFYKEEILAFDDNKTKIGFI